jgi:two-component system, chemotaxis family, protein-glutamate methylesterase/glutaminase
MAVSNDVQVRVLLGDDSGVMLRAVSRLLESRPEVDLVGVCGNFEETVRLADELQPDVIVLDLRMAQKVDGDALRFKVQHPSVRVLAITAGGVDESEARALASQIQADTLMDKMTLDEQLIPTILRLGTQSR